MFHVKLNKVTETIVPEQDDEFAKDVSEYDTLAALKKSIKADLAAKRQEAVDREFENEAVVLAGKNMTCDIPACMIDEQVDKHLEQFAYQLQSQGMKMEDYIKMIGGDVKGMRDSMRPMAEQTVRSNILLSETAHIATQPQLEIYADDVKCSHGATVGQMDSEAVLYMRQRGLSEVQARRLQIEGFVGDVVRRCGVEPWCETMMEAVRAKMEKL